MRRFVLGWKALGHEQRLKARIVNYADDFVICCRGTADQAMTVMRTMMETLKLTVNETKTHVCRLPEETFDFLGYTFGRYYSPRSGRAYLGAKPSQKKVERLCRETSELTASNTTFLDVDVLIGRLNRKIRGWANYFRLGSASRAYRAIDQHVVRRLRQWLCRKHKVQERKYLRFPDPFLYRELGLTRLRDIRRDSAWATA